MANIKSIGGNPIVPASVEDGAINDVMIADNTITDAKLVQTGGVLSAVDELDVNFLASSLTTEIDLSLEQTVNACVTYANKWTASVNFASWILENDGYDSFVVETASDQSCHVSFLSSETFPTPTDGAAISYFASGESGYHTVDADSMGVLDVPSDCTHIVVEKLRNRVNVAPRRVLSGQYMPLKQQVERIDDALVGFSGENPSEHTATNSVDLGELMDGYIRKDSGRFVAHGQYKCTDFIPILPTTLYMMVAYPANDMSGTAFYDAQKNFIVGYGAEQIGGANNVAAIVPPENAAYIRMTRRNSSTYKQMALYVPFLSENVSTLADMLIDIRTGASDNPLDNIIRDGGLFRVLNKVGVIGDSLSVGGMNTIGSQTLDPDTEKRWYSWPQVLSRMTGVEMQAFAAGGWNTSDWLNAYGNNDSFVTNWCFAYIIGLGENDRTTSHHVDLGTEADVSTTSRAECGASYYGNLANIVMRCHEAAPSSRIFMLTNPRPEGESSGYNAAVRYVASQFGTSDNVFLVDLYQYGHAIYAQYITDQNYFYGGHMTAIGYIESAYHISTCIDWIIRSNPRLFRDVQFINGAS